MDTEWIFLISCALSVGFLVYGYLTNRTPLEENEDRLSVLVGRDGRPSTSDATSTNEKMSWAQFLSPIARSLVPKSHREHKRLKDVLVSAGFHSQEAISVFAAFKVIALLSGAALMFGLTAVIPLLSEHRMLSIAAGALIAYLVPSLVLNHLVRTRQQEIRQSIPNAIDLLVVAIEAGQALDGALRWVSKEIRESDPALQQEISLYTKQFTMGRPRPEALRELGSRSGVADLNSLATTLIQADRFGASIANSMRQLSDSMRRKRRQQAEERAQKLAVKLILPLVLFIFPGIFVVLVGPAALMMVRDLKLVP